MPSGHMLRLLYHQVMAQVVDTIAHNGTQPIPMIWHRRTLDRMPEAYYIVHDLLAQIGAPIRVITVESIYDAPFEDGVIIASMGTEFAPYMEEAARRGQSGTVLLHLGDELAEHDLIFYKHADLVLRNYWFADICAQEKVMWVANGYAEGTGPVAECLPSSQRQMAGFFAGAVKNRALSDERVAMCEAVEQANLPFHIHKVARMQDRLSPASYAAFLRNARLALVPGGNSPETIRLYDALENGAVPIMLRSAFVGAPEALDNAPLLLLDSWQELPALYADIGEDIARIEAHQAELWQWWQGFKSTMRERVGQAVRQAMSKRS